VPSGRTATGGCGLIPKLSITDRTQPAVPSPPQTRIRRFASLPYNSSLKHSTNSLIIIIIIITQKDDSFVHTVLVIDNWVTIEQKPVKILLKFVNQAKCYVI